jgi:hypothetical protein
MIIIQTCTLSKILKLTINPELIDIQENSMIACNIAILRNIQVLILAINARAETEASILKQKQRMTPTPDKQGCDGQGLSYSRVKLHPNMTESIIREDCFHLCPNELLQKVPLHLPRISC